MEYEKAVAKARTLSDRSETDQWELARLTYQIVVERGVALRKWAADIGRKKDSVAILRDVWARYGDVYDRRQRTNLPFIDYYTLARVPEDEADGLRRAAERKGRRISTEQRVRQKKDPFDQMRDLVVRDPAVRDRLFKDREFRELFGREYPMDGVQERARPRKRAARRADSEYVQTLDTITRRFNLLLSELVDVKLPKGARRSIKAAADELRTSLGWLDDLDSGDRSFVDALDQVLEETDDIQATDLTARGTPPKRKSVEDAGEPSAEADSVEATPRAKPDRERRERGAPRDPDRRSGRERRAKESAG